MINVRPEFSNFIQQVWYERWKFCGCYSPEDVLDRIRDVLAKIRARSADCNGTSDVWIGHTNAIKATCGSSEIDFALMMYLLHAARLTEHGGTVGGSWLSSDGERMLIELETIERDWWMRDDDDD